MIPHEQILVALDAGLRCGVVFIYAAIAWFTISQLVHIAFALGSILANAFDYEGEVFDEEEEEEPKEPKP